MQQEYNLYTPDDFETWQLLYERQIPLAEKSAYPGYLEGIKKLDFSAYKIPVFAEMNQTLKALTGWELFVVPGVIPGEEFFDLLRQKKFCASTWLRSRDKLDYLEEPDMFHDVFGHVPGLTDPYVTSFLEKLATLAMEYINDLDIIELISRVYWYTIEFGLLRMEHGEVKIFGAGILSSVGETLYCVSPEAVHVTFDVIKMLDTPYRKDVYQEQYFVLDSLEQLEQSIPDIDAALKKRTQSLA